jgi:hypothetical protein
VLDVQSAAENGGVPSLPDRRQPLPGGGDPGDVYGGMGGSCSPTRHQAEAQAPRDKRDVVGGRRSGSIQPHPPPALGARRGGGGQGWGVGGSQRRWIPRVEMGQGDGRWRHGADAQVGCGGRWWGEDGTCRLTVPEPVTADMQPRCDRRVRCSPLVWR